MSVISYDDQKNALLDHIRAAAFVADFPSLIISARLPATKSDDSYYLTAVRRGGPITNDNYPEAFARFDIWCYATSHYEAQKVASALIAYLVPQYPAVAGFLVNGVCCTNIRVEMGMTDEMERRLLWPAILFSVMLTINPGVHE